MGRYSYSNRTEADGLKKIETSFLKKHGYLNGWKYGSIVWTNNYSDIKNDVGIESSTLDNGGYLRIHYTQTDRETEEKKDFDYKIPLTTTNCNYGGKRYWFTCPWYKNGVYCGKRVGVLYKNGDYFACRHCYNLTYASRKLSGFAKAVGSSLCAPDIDEMREKIKRTHYNGKMTRKYASYLRASDKFENTFIALAGLLDKKTRNV